MAAENEDIIIIEDSDAALDSQASSENKINIDDEDEKQKKIILFGGITVIVVLLIVVTVLLMMFKKSQEHSAINLDSIDEKLQKSNVPTIEPSKLENMIAKANYLYANGSKEKALTLYENIAQYSEAISEYNLGVAQFKDKQYKTALETFQKAINNKEKICVSAINAAVCSLYLNDKESFQYYIDLAYAYLPYEIDSPLYSYYYTLIRYYNKDYLAALSSLKHSTLETYPETQNHLKAKINALYDNNYDALDAMEKIDDGEDVFSKALLYARIGDYSLAVENLQNAIIKNIQPAKAQLALGLIQLKAGHMQDAAMQIKNVTDMFPLEVYKSYPIRVKLKDSLFDPQKAQQLYRSNILESKNIIYQKIFYFSPYKIFNANQTISYIRKGNANIYIDNVESAQKYLKRSSSSSSVNIGVTRAIKKALALKIREANKELQKLIKTQPKHSILHYNLALTYAQLGDMNNAYKHFLRSYHLDAKNYLSGVYAIMSGQLINKDTKKLKSILLDSLALEEKSEKIELYNTLLHLSANNFVATVDWLDNTYKQRPLYLALNHIIGLRLHNYKAAQKAANKLTILFPNDILPHLMYIDSEFYKLKPAKYAEKVNEYLKKQKFHFNDLYFGPYITRYLYIQENLITGQLFYLRKQLKDKLDTTNEYTQEIESGLALASLYDKAFEESYTLYNHLIDELKVRDSYTLYLAAVASTAANHHGNAIALLELSKMKNKSFYESRYALALLYMEIQNNEGATIELSRILKDGFSSNYFEFDIDKDKLLYQKQHPQEK
ncbi:tetratricopeptide repeat protein [Sulfurimonas sp.]|uniref:tetratricopeptide repeat protein n=1 Tax=Sulfurimonas sp. TaxID=2022749 RepID=UPI002624F59D|nr:tetratricopeptide repeat protein [Sulfurimonas sp.]